MCTTPWTILGIPETSTEAEIRSAYKSLALVNHPDKAPEAKRDLATAIFVKLQAAYEDCLGQRPVKDPYYDDADLDREQDPSLRWAQVNATMHRNWRIKQTQKQRRRLDLKYTEALNAWEAHRRQAEAEQHTKNVAEARFAEQSRIHRDDRNERWRQFAQDSNAGSDRYTHVIGIDTAAQVIVGQGHESAIDTMETPVKPWWENEENSGYGDTNDDIKWITWNSGRKLALLRYGEEGDRAMREISKPNREWANPNQQQYLPSSTKGIAIQNLSRARKQLQNTARQIEATEKRNDQGYMDKWVRSPQQKYDFQRKAMWRREREDKQRKTVRILEERVANFEETEAQEPVMGKNEGLASVTSVEVEITDGITFSGLWSFVPRFFHIL